MTTQKAEQPTFWRTVKLLLQVARTRAGGRRERQQQLLQNRSDGKTMDWGVIGFVIFVLFMFVINGAVAYDLRLAVEAAQRAQIERQGRIVVNSGFFEFAKQFANSARDSTRQEFESQLFSHEAKSIAREYGGSTEAIEKKLRRSVVEHGASDLITSDAASPGLSALARTGALPAMLGSCLLLVWGMMLAFQGEGADLDFQRRRHPIWEWLFSHPVAPGAVFLAEMLNPIAANPMYWGGPVFVGLLYGSVYDLARAFLAIFLVGIPITVAAACMGKALEIGIMLRFPPRSRGAIIGLLNWLGYTSMMGLLVGAYFIPKLIGLTSRFLFLFTAIPWPWLSLFLGACADGSFSFLSGMLFCWMTSMFIVAGSVWFSVWGAKRGLSGNFASDAPVPAGPGRMRFGKRPLYRKELLWFARDRSAIVQTLLVPISVAGFQLFNLRGILAEAQGAWNYLCGAGIFFGTYFLWILGPKSLQSEGTALWIALTWPQGLESLLKAKAWLWSLLSSGLVAIVLCYAAFSFPAAIWKIALVGVGWFFFARSMAEKSVTLVTVSSASGEPEKVPRGRQWAASLGMLTFAVGIVTAQWQLAVTGIVYSFLTAAAMWQNFRARLPYLYDPWSEQLPKPPTLMHAMVSISILVEAAAVLSMPLLFVAGRANLAAVQALAYAISAVVVSLLVASFLRDRDVQMREVWCWDRVGKSIPHSKSWAGRFGLEDHTGVLLLFVGAVCGVSLGLFANGYMAVLRHVPAVAEMLRKSQQQMAGIPNIHFWFAVMAICFAPFAEEYLFRGLLFRALDREWGGWRAIVGSAAFFAIYHPPLAWLPVALLGAANALLFRRTGRLAPAVILHMFYNVVVLL